MRQTRLLMGMPITLILSGRTDGETLCDMVFDYLRRVDERYSTYKPTSEISRINAGEIQPEGQSSEMKHILELCAQTTRETGGYFDIEHDGKLDPSGLVKGWAIQQAAFLLRDAGVPNFCLSAGGDMQLSGTNESGQVWEVGIRNPLNRHEVVKKLQLSDCGVATSGTYIRGQHIYNPFQPHQPLDDVLSLTVIGPSVYDADRFATAAFAMGKDGIAFIESLPGLEGYMIDAMGIATFTSNFERYVKQ